MDEGTPKKARYTLHLESLGEVRFRPMAEIEFVEQLADVETVRPGVTQSIVDAMTGGQPIWTTEAECRFFHGGHCGRVVEADYVEVAGEERMLGPAESEESEE